MIVRLLRPFTVIEESELRQTLLLFLNLFVLLATYYLLKTVREVLILTEGGAEIKSYSSAGQALLLLIVVPLYSKVAASVTRVRLIAGLTLFFAINLLVFYAFGIAGARVGVIFFLWVGVFNVMIVSQAWAFAADLYTEDQGKRLFPLIGLGASLGSFAGARVAGDFLKAAGVWPAFLICAVLLAFTSVIVWVVNRGACVDCGNQRNTSQQKLDGSGGFTLVFSDRYLLLIAILVLLLNIANTMGEFVLSRSVLEEAARTLGAGATTVDRQKFIGGFYGSFFSNVNLLGLILQFVLVSRILRWTHVRGALFVLPLISLAGSISMLAIPSFLLFRAIKTMENATDYSLQSTARQALFLLTSREAKYKAKAAIDTFFWRAGDLTQAGIVWIGSAVSLTLSGYLAVNTAVGLTWLLVAWALFREHRRRSAAAGSTD